MTTFTPKRWLCAGLLALCSACSSIDFDAPKPVSHALPASASTYLGQQLAEQPPLPPGEASFHLLADGIDALAARLLLAERAERSLDVQYYMLADDLVGRAFMLTLLRAADRGVRVRLLLDDINTAGMDASLAALNTHPNLELRLFNPFASRGMRAFDAWDFRRLNRRMHNKSFTVDNQFTIVGGRNIANEYFAANPVYNFGDLDTVAYGPVVHAVSNMFDYYWNHSRAVPIEQLRKGEADLPAERQRLADALEGLEHSRYAQALRASLSDYLEGDKGFYSAPFELVFDSPDKTIPQRAGEAHKITTPLAQTVTRAQRELLVISPYFVPRDAGVENLVELQRSGVQVDVVTNSLASSDHLLVYGGYAPARKPLLRAGVRLYEMRGDLTLLGTEAAGTSTAKSSLHTKAFVVDRRYFFLGSFNWDPRSAELNTELGVIVDSAELVSPLVELIYAELGERAYHVSLEDDKHLRWQLPGRPALEREPETGFLTRLLGTLAGWLPIESQL